MIAPIALAPPESEIVNAYDMKLVSLINRMPAHRPGRHDRKKGAVAIQRKVQWSTDISALNPAT
ncbi:hypothetical protein MXAZACID_16664 [Acidocella sp. MX-AZ02]|nr:hypothetical protein MXAZACID_16664 [Acidocella sp. MX-AZ02]